LFAALYDNLKQRTRRKNEPDPILRSRLRSPRRKACNNFALEPIRAPAPAQHLTGGYFAMMIARWSIEARFGYKPQAIEQMQRWMFLPTQYLNLNRKLRQYWNYA